MRATVYLVGGTSTSVTIEVPDGTPPGEILEESYRHIEASLCHHCARHMDVPDEWEPIEITVDSKTIWTERSSGSSRTEAG